MAKQFVKLSVQIDDGVDAFTHEISVDPHFADAEAYRIMRKGLRVPGEEPGTVQFFPPHRIQLVQYRKPGKATENKVRP